VTAAPTTGALPAATVTEPKRGKIGDSKATVVDQSGAVIGTVVIPMEPIQANLQYDRLTMATDWTNHVWYGRWGDAPVYLVEAALTTPH
jgi:hypothetical protein